MPEEKTPERYWPSDGIGNVIHKGDLLLLKVPEQAILVRVADVQPAGTIKGPDDKPMQLQGTIMLGIQIPYQPRGGLPMALKLQEPEQSIIKPN